MARDFNGTTDYIRYTKALAATDLETFTYSFSIIRDTAGSNKNIFWSGSTWHDNFHSFIQYDNGLSRLAFVTNWSTAEARWTVPNTASDSSWHNHVVSYSYSATTNDPTWYIDGVSQTVTESVTPSGTSNHTTDDGNLAIGAGHDGSYEWWDGKIAEFAIWNRILTSAESISISNGMSARSIPYGLVFYAPLANGPADIVGQAVPIVSGGTNIAHPPINFIKSTSNSLRPRVFAPGRAR